MTTANPKKRKLFPLPAFVGQKSGFQFRFLNEKDTAYRSTAGEAMENDITATSDQLRIIYNRSNRHICLTKEDAEQMDKLKKNLLLVDFANFHQTKGEVCTSESGKRYILPSYATKTPRPFRFLIADFDKCPDNFPNFEVFFENMVAQFPDAWVTRSVSKKVKIFFFVENNVKEDTANDLNFQKAALSTLLGGADSELSKCCDMSWSGINVSLCDIEMILDYQLKTIRGSFKLAGKAKALAKEAGYYRNGRSPRKGKKAGPFGMFRGTLPKEFAEIAFTKPRSRVVRYVLGNMFLATTNGGALCRSVIAKKCNASIVTVVGVVKALIDSGCLTLKTKHDYLKKQAAIYKASGALAEFFAKGGAEKTFKSTRALTALPSTIADGEWHETLFNVARSIDSRTAFFEWFASVPGSDLKDRRKKAESIWNKSQQYKKTPIATSPAPKKDEGDTMADVKKLARSYGCYIPHEDDNNWFVPSL